MNIIRDLINFFRIEAGIIFASQKTKPALGWGVPALWHDESSNAFRVQFVGGQVADLATMAAAPDSDPVGTIALEHRFVVPAGLTGSVDVVLPSGGEVVDVILHKTGAAGGGAGTIQVVNVGSGAAITEPMSIDAEVGAVIRATQIAALQNTIMPSGALRFVRTRQGSTDESCIAYVRTLRRK